MKKSKRTYVLFLHGDESSAETPSVMDADTRAHRDRFRTRIRDEGLPRAWSALPCTFADRTHRAKARTVGMSRGWSVRGDERAD